MNYKDQIDIERMPRHIAITMDGNGRWAKKQNMASRVFGHQNGVKSVRKVVEAAREMNIEFLTLYAFSTENWNRPQREVNALMTILVQSLRKEVKQLNENGVRLKTIGDLEKLPRACVDELKSAMELTRNNDKLQLTLALSYSARWELSKAIREIAEEAAQGSLDPSIINEEFISSRLTTAGIPDPELLIRTSGEYRISNYLLWQIAYTELYFTETLWPDFDKEEFYKAIVDYQSRERRFGKISEQVDS